MPTAIIRPAVETAFTMIDLHGGTTVEALDPGDPVAHDDAGSYCGGELGDVCEYQVLGVPADMLDVTDFKMGHRSHNRNEAACSEECRAYANAQWGAYVLPVTGNGWTTGGPATYARPGGGTWSPPDFVNSNNAFRIGGVVNGNAILVFPRITSVWGELYYTEKGGSCFVCDVGAWIPPLLGLGANLLYREIATLFRSFQIRPSNREDFEAIKNALAIRPRFCFSDMIMAPVEK